MSGRRPSKTDRPTEPTPLFPPTISKSIARRQTPDKGIGVFATAPIRKGTYLIQEQALVSGVPAAQHMGQTIRAIETQIFATLLDDKRWKFLGLARAEHLVNKLLGDFDLDGNPFGEALHYVSAVACATYHTNAFGCGVYENISRVNHSCTPNAEMRGDAGDGVGTVFALRDIAVGEEITLCYVGEVLGDDAVQADKFEHLLHYGARIRRSGHDVDFLAARLQGQLRELAVMHGATNGQEECRSPILQGPVAASVAIGEGFDVACAHRAMVELNMLADQEGIYLYEIFGLYTTCQTLARLFNEIHPSVRNIKFCIWWDKQMDRFAEEFWRWGPKTSR